MAVNTKLQALYLFFGGTATSNKWNAVDPRDLDAAFRITWSGTITFSANGWQGISGSTFGDTHFIPSTNYVNIDNSHISSYTKTDSSISSSDFGSQTSSGALLSAIAIWIRYGDNVSYADFVSNSTSSDMISISVPTSQGLSLLTRTSSTLLTYYKNAVSIATAGASTATNGTPNVSFYIGARNNNGTASTSTLRQYASTTIGLGLTTTEQANLLKRIQIFNIRLKRAVGNNGTLLSGATFASDTPSSLTALQFSTNFDGGSSAKITTSDIVLSDNQSVSVWFKATAFGGVVFGKSANTSTKILPSTTTGITINNDANAGVQTFTVPTMSTGVWYNLIINRIGSGNVKIYLNGTESTSGTLTLGTGVITINMIGEFGTAGSNFNGKLSDMRKFDSVLSATDISNLAAGSEPVTNSTLHLKMNEGSGTTAWDYIV